MNKIFKINISAVNKINIRKHMHLFQVDSHKIICLKIINQIIFFPLKSGLSPFFHTAFSIDIKYSIRKSFLK